MLNSTMELGGLGRRYLQAESYGIAAFCFYRALQQNRMDESAWNGLVLSLSLMRRENETRTVLARYALQGNGTYDRELMNFAMMLWNQNPRALGEWISIIAEKSGNIEKDKLDTLFDMARQMQGTYQVLEEKEGEQKLEGLGMFKLSDTANRRIELDRITTESPEALYDQLKQWLERSENTLASIRMLCMMPDPRSEKLLRRACRNEELDPKARTHAALALRWLGVRGNVKLHKMGEAFVIDLDHPEPELTVSIPAAYKPVLDRMKLWFAMKQGLVTEEQYELHASTDEPSLPEELNAKVQQAEVPPAFQEAVHVLIRAAYDHYYPLVPKIKGMRQWSVALVLLMKDYVEGIGEFWPFGEPDKDEIAVGHTKWLLSASPDFYNSIAELRAVRQQQARA